MKQIRKKAIAGLLAVTFAASSAEGIPLLHKTAHAAVSFTHNEWTGKNGTEDVFAVNREPASVNAVTFQSSDAAADAVWDYNARTKSDYFQLLTGSGQDWELKVVQNAERAQNYLSSGLGRCP